MFSSIPQRINSIAFKLHLHSNSSLELMFGNVLYFLFFRRLVKIMIENNNKEMNKRILREFVHTGKEGLCCIDGINWIG